MHKTSNTVDIYGACGAPGIVKGSPREEEQISKNKFYISFESARCPEYATEKLYKVIVLNISQTPPVPIVMGPNKIWYEKNLPEKSFVHVDDFDSPEALAKYLLFLNSNDTEYMKYLNWRRYYVRTVDSSIRCKLCKSLVKGDNITGLFGKHEPIVDFERFWNKAKCKSPAPNTNVRFP